MNKASLKSILNKINSIALIEQVPILKEINYKVMKYLIEKGYKVFPINPNEKDNKILGRKCYTNLEEIKHKIDMVDIFRSKEYVWDITLNAIKLGVDLI